MLVVDLYFGLINVTVISSAASPTTTAARMMMGRLRKSSPKIAPRSISASSSA